MKSIKDTRFARGRMSLLCVLVLMLLPLLALQAQEQADNPDAPPPRPAEESLLILDTGEEAEGEGTEEVQGGPLVSSWDDQFYEQAKEDVSQLRFIGFDIKQIGLQEGQPAYLVQRFPQIDITHRDEDKINYERTVGDVDDSA